MRVSGAPDHWGCGLCVSTCPETEIVMEEL
jgi:Pyruvate/2-oxoacid:ferredoxin oxidoreductase delta subunit